jgi:hypothetical protein
VKPVKDVRKAREYWSDCGLIYLLDGKGWGLDEGCGTWCLGEEADVLKAMETGELTDYLTPQQRRVLCHVLELSKEILKDEPREYTRASIIRGGPSRTFERRQANIGQASQGRRPALFKTR